MRILSVLLTVVVLTACNKLADNPPINPQPAETVPPNATFKKFKTETLDKAALKALGVTGDDLVIVVKESGKSILYGMPGKKFKKGLATEVDSHISKLKKMGKEPNIVNDFRIQTIVNSPGCNWIGDGSGNIIWYPAGCP
ncbi:MAG: hypothetical protein OEY52_08765 [Gammaproteobacteria bacterium]|nr:hypothetical protein [Gammaproteobacteria bacterium]